MDLIICDEAHRMAASYFAGEIRAQRHKLGKLLGALARNFLLMSATPHNGKGGLSVVHGEFLTRTGSRDGSARTFIRRDVSDMMRRPRRRRC